MSVASKVSTVFLKSLFLYGRFCRMERGVRKAFVQRASPAPLPGAWLYSDSCHFTLLSGYPAQSSVWELRAKPSLGERSCLWDHKHTPQSRVQGVLASVCPPASCPAVSLIQVLNIPGLGSIQDLRGQKGRTQLGPCLLSLTSYVDDVFLV